MAYGGTTAQECGGAGELPGDRRIGWGIEELGAIGGRLVGAPEINCNKQTECNGDAEVSCAESLENCGAWQNMERNWKLRRFFIEVGNEQLILNRVWVIKL